MFLQREVEVEKYVLMIQKDSMTVMAQALLVNGADRHPPTVHNTVIYIETWGRLLTRHAVLMEVDRQVMVTVILVVRLPQMALPQYAIRDNGSNVWSYPRKARII